MLITSSRWVVSSALTAIVILALQSSNVASAKQRLNSLKVSARTAKASVRSSVACTPCAKATLKSRAKSAKLAPCHPRGYVDPKIAKNFNAAMRDLKRAGIKPEVTSTWRSSQDQARLHNCSGSRRCRRANPGLYRALPPGQSLHEAGLAVDMSGIATGPRGAKRLTPRGRRIVGIMQKNGFRWRYGLADPAHFEANPRRAGYRNLKQAITRSQTTCDAKLADNSRADKRQGRGHQSSANLRRAATIKQPPAQVSSTKQGRHNAGA